jgi:hypothetical protein
MQPEMKIFEVREKTWPLVHSFVQRWEDSRHGMHTVSEVLAHCIAGEWQLWALAEPERIRAVFATRVYTNHKGNFLEVPMLVGNNAKDWWCQVDDKLTELSRSSNAKKRIVARKGWARLMASRFSVYCVVLGQEAANEERW